MFRSIRVDHLTLNTSTQSVKTTSQDDDLKTDNFMKTTVGRQPQRKMTSKENVTGRLPHMMTLKGRQPQKTTPSLESYHEANSILI